MSVTIVEHPLIAHHVTIMRDAATPGWLFRRSVSSLATIVGVTACSQIATQSRDVQTPVAAAVGAELSPPGPLLVPILRAGLAMLESFLALIPVSEVGFFGTKRDEHTLSAHVYMDRLPANLSSRQVIVMDPMLATGGSLVTTIEHLVSRGATDITCVCLVASPAGVAAIEAASERLGVSARLFVATVDTGLTSQGFISPGVGDAGDRLFGAF